MKTLAMFVLLLMFAVPCFAQDRFQLDTQEAPYVRFAEKYNNYGSQYAVNPPKIYSGNGTYLGELSTNKYAPDSVSNPYGVYGSRYSPTSINNPYSPYGYYRTQPIYVYPRNR